MTRKIIHVDMDAFYASIELRDNPELLNMPVIVGGDPSGRGVVATANYEARKFGIRSAMSSRMAQKLCPHVVFIPPRFNVYKDTSKTIREVFLSFTPNVEPLSLDEAYLDVTEASKVYGSAQALAVEIKSQIRIKTGLTSSAGIGPNKLIAKIASDYKKPDGITVVSPLKVLEFLENLPVRKIPGVGPVTEQKLAAKNILTISELRKTSERELFEEFGKTGLWLFNAARGIDEREVQNSRTRKSVSAEDTFAKDLTDLDEIQKNLFIIASKVSKRLDVISEKGRTITLKITFSDFSKVTRSKTLAIATSDPNLLFNTTLELLVNNSIHTNTIRLLGIGVSNLLSTEKKVESVFSSELFGTQLSFAFKT